MSKPLVSVCLITYNQAQYIKDAIEGVLAQKVTFPIELIIADDFSTDGTREIIIEYQKKYPELINLILQEKNVGPHQNWMDLIQSPVSEYIAYFEGDDYWIDDEKLQSQVDFLEAHPGSGMVCTDYRKYFALTDTMKPHFFSDRRYASEVAFKDYLLDMSSIGTATILIRRALVQDYFAGIPAEKREGFIVGDTPLWLYVAANSKISVIPRETAVYRVLGNSACHFKTPDDHYRFVLKGFEMADFFYEMYGNNDIRLLESLTQKKLKAALFHGYRIMDAYLAKTSYKKLITYPLTMKRRISAGLMLIGSHNEFMNRLTAVILRTKKSGLKRI